MTSFLSLPQELRNAIYEYYVSTDGYHYHYESGKLRTSAGPIDLALTYTCRQVASEMLGLALRSNVIHFSTLYSDPERMKARLFNAAIINIHDIKTTILQATGTQEIRSFMTPEILTELAQWWPQFVPHGYLSGEWDTARSYEAASWSEGAGSERRDFTDYALSLLSADSGFAKAIARLSSSNRDFKYLKDLDTRNAFLPFDSKPWTIPSKTYYARTNGDAIVLGN